MSLSSLRWVTLIVLSGAWGCSDSGSSGTGSPGGSAGTSTGGSAGSGTGGSGTGGSGAGGSGTGGTAGSGTGGAAGTATGGSAGSGTGGSGTGGSGTGGSGTGGSGTGGAGGTATGAPSAAELLALTAQCTELTAARYATDDGENPTVPVCDLDGAVFWTADLDIDCDGVRTTECNENTDPAFQDQTAVEASTGAYLDAAQLPYVVIPSRNGARWDYRDSDVRLGAVVAVIRNGQVAYGPVGDTGPDDIIGEASYAMGATLGVDPDPSTGGTDGPVTYIVFKGAGAVVSPVENHAAAVTLGEGLARSLVDAN